MARPSQCPECGCFEGCLYPRAQDCAERNNIEVGWIIKWRSYFGEKTGKVVGTVREGDHLIGYDVSENGHGTQGFPGSVRPRLVPPRDIIEVVSHEA